MATAVVRTETKTIQKEVPEKVIKLELTEDEASFWLAVTMNIGGDPRMTYRKYSSSLSDALLRVGVRTSFQKYVSRGAIYCGNVTA